MLSKVISKNKSVKNYEIKELNKQHVNSLLMTGMLDFNRVVSKSHVSKMKRSIEACGILRLPVIGDVSMFDPMMFCIIDGQHFLRAIVDDMSETDTIQVIVKTYINKRQVIRDIAKLNNTTKSWDSKDYLDAWYNFGAENSKYYLNYEKLYDYDTGKFSKVSTTLLIEIFTSDMNKFKEGELEFFNLKFSEELAEIIRHIMTVHNKSSFPATGLRIWATARLNSGIHTDFKKLRARLDQALLEKRDEKYSNGRDDFKLFVDKIYNEI